MAAGLTEKFPIVSEDPPELPFELRTERFDHEELVSIQSPSEAGQGPLRTSSYTIYVDLPDNRNDLLLVHGYTGAYDRVSRGVATYLRSRELRRPPKPLYGDWRPEPEVDDRVSPPSDEAIAILKERGYLTTLTREAEEARLARIARKLQERSMKQAPSYIVMPTYECNLRCSYCFQDHMRTDPRFKHLLRKIEPSVADRILAAMPQIEAMHGLNGDTCRHRNIGFFGGEPLLEDCRPVVEHFIEGTLAMGPASFWAVTNGTDLHVYRDLLSPQLISRLQITLDGPQAEHDRRRIYADRSGTFERIAHNIDLALELNVKVKVRLNIDRNNIATLPALAQDFVERGWGNHPFFSSYVTPIRPENERTDRRTTFNTWELDNALLELSDGNPSLEVIGRPDGAIKLGARRIISGLGDQFPDYRESFCGAHNRMYIFDAFGDIYACWERTGDSRIRIGKVAGGGTVSLDRIVNDLWRSRTIASNPACRKCRYALHCGGGCAVLAVGKTGNYHANYCDGFASRFRSRVSDAYLGHISGEEISDSMERLCDQ